MNRCKTSILMIGLLAAILLEGCGQSQTGQTPADEPQKQPEIQTEQPDQQADADADGVERFELTDDTDSAVLLQVEVRRPQLEAYVEKGAYANIRKYYDNLYAKERNWWKGDLADFAQEDREAIKQNGGVFEPYEVREDYKITCNNAQFLSIRRTSYTYTGGAHGNQTIMGETFRKEDGTQVMLADLFADEAYRDALLREVKKEVNARAAAGDVSYYDNVGQLVEDTFDPGAFYLTDAPALVLVYATYTLAPYAAGPQEIIIPFSDLADSLNTEYVEG